MTMKGMAVMTDDQRRYPEPYPPDAAEKTQQTLDAINNGTLTLGPDDASFWTLEGAEQAVERRAAREMEAG